MLLRFLMVTLVDGICLCAHSCAAMTMLSMLGFGDVGMTLMTLASDQALPHTMSWSASLGS